MSLEVLIASPSGPFGELIRLSLEADPEFHCVLLDNAAEIRQTLPKKQYQAIIYDCSFVQPDPNQLIQLVRDEKPNPAIILVPPENRPAIDPGLSQKADGWISRPFDASDLPEKVRTAIKLHKQPPVSVESVEQKHKNDSWWNAFQSGIKDTAASNGVIIQNGVVIASTPGTTTALQQQVTASVLRFWNPKDSADLMRYVKDLVTGQEWMMFATNAVENAVLVLLFLPQTPITKVRSQTIALAKHVSSLMQRSSPSAAKPEINFGEMAEPPRLYEILGEESGEPSQRVIKKEFPVEWFKEADLPELNPSSQMEEETTASEVSSRIIEGDSSNQEAARSDQEEEVEEELRSFAASLGIDSHHEDVFQSPQVENKLQPETQTIDKGMDPDLVPASLFSPEDDQILSDPAEITEVPFPEVAIRGDITEEKSSEPSESSLDMDQPGLEARTETPIEDETGSGVDIPSTYKVPVIDSTSSIFSATATPGDLDLGIFEEFYLKSRPESGTGLEEIQPIPINPEPDEVSPEAGTSGIPADSKVESGSGEVENLPDEELVEPAISAIPSDEIPSDYSIKTSETDDLTGQSRPISDVSELSEIPVPDEEPSGQSEIVEVSNAIAETLPDTVTPQNELPDFDFFTGTTGTEETGSQESETSEPLQVDTAISEPYNGETITADDADLHFIQEGIASSSDSKTAEPVLSGSENHDLYSRMSQLESAETIESEETYTIALIPRLEKDILVRQIAGSLGQVLNRLCLAFNWKLDNLMIRPTYMQWTVTLPSAFSPEDMIGIVRKETTLELEKMDFLLSSRPSDQDFWAPECMTAAGKEFTPSIHWQNFVLRRKSREIV